jgi:hypothetical protein
MFSLHSFSNWFIVISLQRIDAGECDGGVLISRGYGVVCDLVPVITRRTN